MTDKELKKLFKNKLDSREVAYNPEAWQRMEMMLDAKMPVVPWYQTSLAWVKGLTAATVTGLSIWFMSVDVDALPSSSPQDQPHSEPIVQQEAVPSESSPLTNQENNISFDQTQESGNDENIDNAFTNAVSESTIEKSENRISPSDNPVTAYNQQSSSENQIAYTSNEEDQHFSEEPLFLYKDEEPSVLSEENDLSEDHIIPKDVSHRRYNRDIKSWRFGVGLDVLTSKTTSGSINGESVSPTSPGFAVGFKVAKRIGARTSIQTAINYSWRSTDGGFKEVDKDYGFGSDQITTEVHENSLHYIEIPLSIQYHLGMRHLLKAGAYTSYLMTTGCEVKTIVQDGFETSSDSESTFLTESKQNKWDAGITFGYHYSLDSDLQIGLEYWQGLVEIQENTNNTQIRASLNYWF